LGKTGSTDIRDIIKFLHERKKSTVDKMDEEREQKIAQKYKSTITNIARTLHN
jgi:hypothetical protein